MGLFSKIGNFFQDKIIDPVRETLDPLLPETVKESPVSSLLSVGLAPFTGGASLLGLAPQFAESGIENVFDIEIPPIFADLLSSAILGGTALSPEGIFGGATTLPGFGAGGAGTNLFQSLGIPGFGAGGRFGQELSQADKLLNQQITAPSLRGLGDTIVGNTATQGGNVANSFLSQLDIPGLSLPPQLGGAGGDIGSLMNITDFLGGGGGSDIGFGVQGLQGFLDPLTGGGSQGLNIPEILSQLTGGGGGFDINNLLKQAGNLLGGQQQGQQPGGFDINKLLSGLGGVGGGTGAGTNVNIGGAIRPPGVSQQFPDFPDLNITPDFFNPFDIISPEKIKPEFFEQFGPTSLEEAVANELFSGRLEEARRSAGQLSSLAGIPGLAPSLFTKDIGPTIASIGASLADLGQQRAGQALTRESGLLNLGAQRAGQALPLRTQTQLGQFGVQGQRAGENFQQDLANALQDQAKTGLVSTGIGGAAGGILSNLFPQLGINTGQGITLGAGLGSFASPFFGGGQGPISLADALSAAGGMATPKAQTGQTQQVNPFGNMLARGFAPPTGNQASLGNNPFFAF